MKVCTDSCILGAWFSQKIAPYDHVLDLGSGTGLLLLMLAQRSQAEMHGIEIDLAAFRQMKQNIEDSPWADRLRAFPGDARSYRFPVKYDFIISNPPFYENDLQSQSEATQLARHSRQLSLQELITTVRENLRDSGSFGLLLPFHRQEEFELMAEQAGLHTRERLIVHHSPSHPPFRSILHMVQKKEAFVPTHRLNIHDDNNKYSSDFVELLKDYYLHL